MSAVAVPFDSEHNLDGACTAFLIRIFSRAGAAAVTGVGTIAACIRHSLHARGPTLAAAGGKRARELVVAQIALLICRELRKVELGNEASQLVVVQLQFIQLGQLQQRRRDRA